MYNLLAEGKKFEALLKERTERFKRAGKGNEAAFCRTNGMKRILVSSKRQTKKTNRK